MNLESEMENISFIEIFSIIYVISKNHTNEVWRKSFQPQLNNIWDKVKNEPLDQLNNYWELFGEIINSHLDEKWYENGCECSIVLNYMDHNYDFINNKPCLLYNKYISEKYEQFTENNRQEYEDQLNYVDKEELREIREEIEIEKCRCKRN